MKMSLQCLIVFAVMVNGLTGLAALPTNLGIQEASTDLVGTVIYNVETESQCIRTQNPHLGTELPACEGEDLINAENAANEASTQTAAIGIAAVYVGACLAGAIGQVMANELEEPKDEQASLLYHSVGFMVTGIASTIYFNNTMSGALVSGAGGVLGIGAGAAFMACSMGTHHFLNIYSNSTIDSLEKP